MAVSRVLSPSLPNVLDQLRRGLRSSISVYRDLRDSRFRQRETRANLASLAPTRPLAAEEREAALRFLRQFHPRYSNLDWHSMLTHATDTFEPGYLHEDIFFGAIEPALNPPERQYAGADKNGYDRLGLAMRVPETVARIVRGRLVDADREPSTMEDAVRRASECGETEVVLKQALGSMAGKAVRIVAVSELPGALAPLLGKRDLLNDHVVQRLVHQHESLAKFNPTSVNTLRIMTYRSRAGVVLVSSVLRAGGTGNRVDNQSRGGVAIGIVDGVLRPTGHSGADHTGYTAFEAHPGSGVGFAGFEVPGWHEAVEACIASHRRIPGLDLLSWDIAIDRDSSPVLIEINTVLQSLLMHQMENGPIPAAIAAEWAERAPFRLVGGLLVRKPPRD